jgi:hypothetical protein
MYSIEDIPSIEDKPSKSVNYAFWLSFLRRARSKPDFEELVKRRIVMFRIRTDISFIAVLLLTAAATKTSADPITLSLQNGVFDSGATVYGTVTIDPSATAPLVSADITYNPLVGPSVTFDQLFDTQGTIPAGFGLQFPVTYGDLVEDLGNPPASPVIDTFEFIIPAALLSDYSGGPLPLCTRSNNCGGGLTSAFYFDGGAGSDQMEAGDLGPVPEPSTLALMLTGAALCAFVVLGRFRRVQTQV